MTCKHRTDGKGGRGAGRRPKRLPCSWKEKDVPMKIQIVRRLNTASALVMLLVTLALPARALNDIWTNTVSGKWENPTNWSFGVVPGATNSIYITNGGFNGKTVTIDATTSGSYSNTMSVTSLSVWGPSASFSNILALTGAGTNTPLHVATTLTLGNGVGWGFLSLSNSALDVGSQVQISQGGMTLLDGSLTLTNGGFQVQSNGSVTVIGATLNLNNGILGLGNNGATNNGGGVGSVVVSNATLNATVLTLGSMTGGVGMFTVQSNSTVNISSNITLVSSSLIVTSTLTLNGGTFTAANGVAQIGSAGNGLLTISGGSNTFRQILLNPQGVGSGGLHLHGGHLRVIGNGSGPGQGLVSNWVLFDGGDLEAGGTSLTIGENTPNSEVTVGENTGGLVGQLAAMYVGYGPPGAGSSGSFENDGYSLDSGIAAELDVTNLMIVGDCLGGAVGTVTMNGGYLCVTNTMGNAQLIISNGTVVLNAPNPPDGSGLGGGALFVDDLIMSNSCGHLINYGQPLFMVTNHLDPTRNADGIGMNNGEKWTNGLDMFDPNWVFAITNINVSVAGNNTMVQLVWTTQGQHMYELQHSDTLTNLLSGKGTTLYTGTGPGAGAGCLSYTYTVPAPNATGFYRVEVISPTYPQ
jgi:hypothetical protein